MSSKIDVVQAWSDAPSGDAQVTASFLAEDFENVMSDGTIQSKAEYVGMASMMFASLPDMDWVLSELREEGESVIMAGHFEGTFQNDLDLTAVGIGVIPASGKKVVWPESTLKIMVEGDKVRRMESLGGSTTTEEFLSPLMG